MSEFAICTAVHNRIKTVLTLPDQRWIDVRPDGKPTSANVADAFIAVHSGGQEYADLNNGIDEYQLVNVTISLKLMQYHIDYWGVKTNQNVEQSFEYAIRKIIGCIHLQPQVLLDANSLIETGVSSGFCEMLRVKHVTPKQECGVSWWGVSQATAGANRILGYSKTINFSGARRVQSIDSYT